MVAKWIGALPTGRRRPVTPSGWALLATWAVFVAVCSYGIGLFSGRLLLLRGASEICGADPGQYAAGPRQFSSLTGTFLPLGNSCRYTDGTSANLVPAYINPTVLALVAVAAVCAGLGVIATVRGEGRDRIYAK